MKIFGSFMEYWRNRVQRNPMNEYKTHNTVDDSLHIKNKD